jgi:hypothetical protein
MTIRFLEVVESQAPGYPFLVGQVIDIDKAWPELVTAINAGRAEVVRAGGSEAAEVAIAVGAETMAVVDRPRGRQR